MFWEAKGENQSKNTMILGKVLTKPIFCIFSRAQAVSQQALFINRPTSFSWPTSQTSHFHHMTERTKVQIISNFIHFFFRQTLYIKFYTYDVKFYTYSVYNVSIFADI